MAVVVVLSLASCRKGMDAPSPSGSSFKNIYCALSGCDTSQMFVSSESATRDEYAFGWASHDSGYVAVTMAGNVASFYKGDTVRVYGSVQSPATAEIFLGNDLVAVVDLLPENNGQPSLVWVVTW